MRGPGLQHATEARPAARRKSLGVSHLLGLLARKEPCLAGFLVGRVVKTHRRVRRWRETEERETNEGNRPGDRPLCFCVCVRKRGGGERKVEDKPEA